MIDLNKNQKELFKWQKENFPNTTLLSLKKEELVKIIRLLQVATGMAEEAGETCHHILKGTQGIRGGINGINKKEVADGVADTFVFGMQTLSLLGMDIEQELAPVITKVLKRNWRDDPEGIGLDSPVQHVSV